MGTAADVSATGGVFALCVQGYGEEVKVKCVKEAKQFQRDRIDMYDMERKRT